MCFICFYTVFDGQLVSLVSLVNFVSLVVNTVIVFNLMMFLAII